MATIQRDWMERERDELMGTSWDSGRTTAKSYTWEGRTSCNKKARDRMVVEWLYRKEPGAPGWPHHPLDMRQQRALLAEAHSITSCNDRSEGIRRKEVIIFLVSVLVRLHAASDFWHINMRKRLINWNESMEGSWGQSENWSTCHTRKSWENWICFRLGKRTSRTHISSLPVSMRRSTMQSQAAHSGT